MRFSYKNLELEVPEGVYEPREDSFLLAEALEDSNLKKKEILDIGTGCGIQALVCARQAKEVTGTDLNLKAINVARKNAKANGLDNVNFIESDLLENIEGKFDIIVFNPPYLPSKKEKSSIHEKAWEGGKRGRKIIEKFLEECESYLKEKGVILIVESSLSSPEETIKKLKPEFDVEVMKEKKVFWEKLVVIKASKRKR